jgi:hypothetical protein
MAVLRVEKALASDGGGAVYRVAVASKETASAHPAQMSGVDRLNAYSSSSNISECDRMKDHMSDASQPRAFKNYPDLSDPVEQERLSPAAVGAFVNIATLWSLNDAQALGLLGVISASTLLEWKTGMGGHAHEDLVSDRYL